MMANINFDFMHYRKIAAGISVAVVLASLISLALNQVNWGLDFTGGTLVEVVYENSIDPGTIRSQLDSAGFNGHVVQYFGSERDILVRIPPQKNLSAKENA
ncbi:MAG: preprotein translocase subunit SecF, partial [Urechidicola sp.]